MRALIALLSDMANPERRLAAARALAAFSGAEAVFALVPDPERPGHFAPAPGFVGTLPAGPAWRAFLEGCCEPGLRRGAVEHPTDGRLVTVSACVADDGTALVFCGGDCTETLLDEASLLLPILGAALRAEHRAAGSAVEAEAALEDARRLNLELRQEQEVRERLIGIVGHDLRTPLSAISLGARMLQTRGGLADADSTVAARIVRSADRMNRMIQQLLGFTRARLGSNLPIERRRVDVDALCREGVGEFELANPKATLRYESSGDCTAECDPDRLSEVVSNLVSNAIKYGAPDRPITVRLSGDAKALVLEVHNDGRAITEERVPTLFEPFRRPKGERSSSDSLGLGLYICNEVVRRHRGSIEVRSNESEGTTFTVRVPRVGVNTVPPPPG